MLGLDLPTPFVELLDIAMLRPCLGVCRDPFRTGCQRPSKNKRGRCRDITIGRLVIWFCFVVSDDSHIERDAKVRAFAIR